MKKTNRLMILAVMVFILVAASGGAMVAMAAGNSGGENRATHMQCRLDGRSGDNGAPSMQDQYSMTDRSNSYVTEVDRGESPCGGGDKGPAGDMGKKRTDEEAGVWIGHGRIAGYGK